jgi:hypothetical protein
LLPYLIVSSVSPSVALYSSHIVNHSEDRILFFEWETLSMEFELFLFN